MALLSLHLTFILSVILTFVNASTITSSLSSISPSSSRASSSANRILSTTLSSRAASSSLPSLVKKYSLLSTSELPVLKFLPGNSYFDFLLQVGGEKQELGLRLDVLQGDVWLPASTAFSPCSATSASSYSYMYTTITYSTDLATDTTPPYTPLTSASASDTSSSSSSYAYTLPVAGTIYGKSCASVGVYNILNSVYGAFIDIYTNFEVSLEEATKYMEVYLSEIIVTGVWAVDNFILSFRSPKLKTMEFTNVPFVYANFSDVGVGSLALGISQAEHGYKYNFISNFVINGLISTNSYSLALGAGNNTYPQLILGGIDKTLIYSDTATNQSNSSSLMALFDYVPVLDETGLYVPGGGLTNKVPAFPIYGWGVTSSATGQSVIFSSSYNDRMEIASYPKPAIFDSRHNYNFIPYSTLVELAIELNAYYSADLGIWLADCSVGSTGTIDMYLGNYTVHMAISNFLNPAMINDTSLAFASGDPACYLTFLPDYFMGYSLMGTPLLKSIYLAVDNENQQMGISQLQDQLKNLGIDTSEATEVQNNEINFSDLATKEPQPLHFGKFSIEDDEVKVAAEATTTSTSEIEVTHGVSSFSRQRLSRTMTITTSTTLSESHVSAYKTVVTVSNVFISDPTTSNREFYAIESGTIPFAQKFDASSSLTLKIPKYAVFTDTSVQSTEVYISDGEVYLQTNDESNQGETQTRKSQSTETDSTIYAFSSLVVSKVSSSRSSGSGSRVHAPRLLHFESPGGETYHGLKVAGYFSSIVLCVIVFF